MKPAHTIVKVHPSVIGVPTYLRNALKQAGPKIKIGCAYRPKIIPTPAFHVIPKKPSRYRKIAKRLAVVGAVACFYLIGSIWGGA